MLKNKQCYILNNEIVAFHPSGAHFRQANPQYGISCGAICLNICLERMKKLEVFWAKTDRWMDGWICSAIIEIIIEEDIEKPAIRLLFFLQSDFLFPEYDYKFTQSPDLLW